MEEDKRRGCYIFIRQMAGCAGLEEAKENVFEEFKWEVQHTKRRKRELWER